MSIYDDLARRIPKTRLRTLTTTLAELNAAPKSDLPSPPSFPRRPRGRYKFAPRTPKQILTVQCAFCPRTFPAFRKTARYCCSSCKFAAWRLFTPPERRKKGAKNPEQTIFTSLLGGPPDLGADNTAHQCKVCDSLIDPTSELFYCSPTCRLAMLKHLKGVVIRRELYRKSTGFTDPTISADKKEAKLLVLWNQVQTEIDLINAEIAHVESFRLLTKINPAP